MFYAQTTKSKFVNFYISVKNALYVYIILFQLLIHLYHTLFIHVIKKTLISNKYSRCLMIVQEMDFCFQCQKILARIRCHPMKDLVPEWPEC